MIFYHFKHCAHVKQVQNIQMVETFFGGIVCGKKLCQWWTSLEYSAMYPFWHFPLQINSTTISVIQCQYQTKHKITSYGGFLVNLNTGLVCGSMCLPNIEWCDKWMFRFLGLCYTSTCGSSSPTDRCLVLSSQLLPCIITYYPDLRKF